MKTLWIAVMVLPAAVTACGGGTKQEMASGEPEQQLTPVGEPIAVDAAYPADQPVRRYLIAGGKDDGKVMVVSRREDAGATIESWTIDGEARPRFERVLREEADGSLVMPEQRSFDRDVRTVFDPPLAVFPAALESDAPFVMTSRMTVHPLKRPKAIKERGTARVEISLRGSEGQEGSGAVVMRTVFTADLQSADVVRTTDRWFVRGEGMSRERYEETVKALGLIIERSAETFSAE